jgi:hypothetical protein
MTRSVILALTLVGVAPVSALAQAINPTPGTEAAQSNALLGRPFWIILGVVIAFAVLYALRASAPVNRDRGRCGPAQRANPREGDLSPVMTGAALEAPDGAESLRPASTCRAEALRRGACEPAVL